MKNYYFIILAIVSLSFHAKADEFSFSKVVIDRLIEVCRHRYSGDGPFTQRVCEDGVYELKKDSLKTITKKLGLCAGKNEDACYFIEKTKAAKISNESLVQFINDECMKKDNLNACLEAVDGAHTYDMYKVRACQLNDFRSCFEIGRDALMYKNHTLAKEFLDKACSGNHFEACFRLARTENISKIEKNKYFSKICEGDFSSLCAEEGEKKTIRFEDRGRPGTCGYGRWSNPDAEYFVGCDRIKYVSCTFLADDELLLGNLIKAGSLAKEGCEKNESYSCTVLGIVEQKKGNKKLSEEILRKACFDNHEQRACDAIPSIKEEFLKSFDPILNQ